MAVDGSNGQAAAGWPKWSGGFSLFTPAIGDVDGRGTVDVAEMTREGYLHLWRTPGKTSADNQAWHWHQDDRNTGHYGTDTRPPAAIADLAATCATSGDRLTFTAPGDDWHSGTAAAYQVFRAAAPITQDTLAAATVMSVSQKPQPAGSAEAITLADAPGQCNFAVRAIDTAGNIGPVRVVATGNAAAAQAGSAQGIPNTAASGPAGAAVAVSYTHLTLPTICSV